MSRTIVIGSLAGLVIAMTIVASTLELSAQAPAAARADAGEAAVAALVAEVRALRADLAAASRNQLRAQLLLGRVQMQEQRLAYLDKQRADTAAAAMVQAQMGSVMRAGFGGNDGGGCTNLPSAEARRDCEANATIRKRQIEEQETRERQLRNQENELANALTTEQARWSDFNARLDELERAIQ
jgi:hypothetical protein